MEKVIIIALLAIIFFIVLDKLMQKRLSERRKARLLSLWGVLPVIEYTYERFKSIGAYYNSKKDPTIDVDDITWQDLDMDQVYLMINNTSSSMGEEYLYSLLRKPCSNQEELDKRSKLIQYFSENEEIRLKLQLELMKLGKIEGVSLYKSINRLDDVDKKSNIPHYLMAIGLCVSIGLIFIKPSIGGLLTVVFIANNIINYYKRQADIDKYLITLAYVLRTIDGAKNIAELDIKIINNINLSLQENEKIFRRFKRGSRILTSNKNSGNFTDIFLDYIRMLFHVDLMKFNSMISFFHDNRNKLNQIYEDIGLLDSVIAVGSFRSMIDYYCEPMLSKADRPFINGEEIYHPLINNPITNSVSIDRSVLITGSNASGKSTFIKALAINALLSQTIYTSLAKQYSSSYFKISSSMALKDNIFENESYYIVEIKSLKRILDGAQDDLPTLCFVDEVLRGTNTLERIAASSRILKELDSRNTLVFAATHDIELTYILGDIYENKHFLEQIKDGGITFDYKIRQGRSSTRNAIKLLDILGYPEDVTIKADKAVEGFLLNNSWDVI